MKCRVSALVGVLTAGQIVVFALPARAQQPTITLNVFAPPVQPRAPVFLNATLTNPTAVSIFELRQTFTFRREHLRFVRARLGVAGDMAGATLTVELHDASGAKVDDKDAAQRVHIRVTAKTPLPTGPLVELEFRQVEDKEQPMRLHQVAEVRDGEGKPIPGLVFSDPDVTVSKELAPAPLKIFGCFFYMH